VTFIFGKGGGTSSKHGPVDLLGRIKRLPGYAPHLAKMIHMSRSGFSFDIQF